MGMTMTGRLDQRRGRATPGVRLAGMSRCRTWTPERRDSRAGADQASELRLPVKLESRVVVIAIRRSTRDANDLQRAGHRQDRARAAPDQRQVGTARRLAICAPAGRHEVASAGAARAPSSIDAKA
jgi:hypothetical protein